MSAKAKLTSDPQQAVLELLAEAGYRPAGHTESETVRIPTARAPVFGGLGGEIRTLGGRARFAIPDSPKRATVGKRTVCLYEVHPTDNVVPSIVNGRRSAQAQHSQVSNFQNFRTRDVDAIREALRANIKVFQLNSCDWWAGYTLESVVKAFKLEMDLGDEEFDNPHELSAEDMDRLHFVDGDDPINKDGTPGGKLTFRDALQQMIKRGDRVPCFFASTEC